MQRSAYYRFMYQLKSEWMQVMRPLGLGETLSQVTVGVLGCHSLLPFIS